MKKFADWYAQCTLSQPGIIRGNYEIKKFVSYTQTFLYFFNCVDVVKVLGLQSTKKIKQEKNKISIAILAFHSEKRHGNVFPTRVPLIEKMFPPSFTS